MARNKRTEQKAEIIRKKMNGTSLDAIAKSTGATITPAIALSLGNPVLPNIGFEPKVVGTAIGLAPNKTSKLIDGNMGVYMVRTKLFVKAPAVKDYNTQIDQLSQQSKGGASYRVIQALRDRAKIDDNRGNKMPPTEPAMLPMPTTELMALRGNISDAVVKILALQAWCAAIARAMSPTACQILVQY